MRLPWPALVLCMAASNPALPQSDCTASDELLEVPSGPLGRVIAELAAPRVVHTEVHRSAGAVVGVAAPGGDAASSSARKPTIVPRPPRSAPANDQQRLFLAVADGDLHRVQALLASPAVDVNGAFDAQSRGRLINIAASYCLPEITEALVRKGARTRAVRAAADDDGVDVHPVGTLMSVLSVDIQMRDHPLTMAGTPARTVEHCEATLRILLDAGADANELADPAEHLSALGRLADMGAFEGDARIAQLLLEHGARADDSPGAGSPLLVAVGRRRADLVSLMLAAGHLSQSTLDTALLQSSVTGPYDMASDILAAGADPNASDRRHRPLLCDALLRLPAARSFALSLVAHHAAVDVACPRGSALGLAVKDPEIAKAMLDRGADPNRLDEMGATALSLAGADDPELIEQLFAHGGRVGIPASDAARYRERGATVGAVSWSILNHRDYLAAQLIVRNQFDAKQDCGAVVYAAGEGALLALSKLLERGGDPNSTSKRGLSALMVAAARGRTNSMDLLLARPGIRVNQTTPIEFHMPTFQIYGENGDTPLWTGHQSALIYAAQNSQMEAAQVLLAHGADVHQKDAQGNTAADYARGALKPLLIQAAQ